MDNNELEKTLLQLKDEYRSLGLEELSQKIASLTDSHQIPIRETLLNESYDQLKEKMSQHIDSLLKPEDFIKPLPHTPKPSSYLLFSANSARRPVSDFQSSVSKTSKASEASSPPKSTSRTPSRDLFPSQPPLLGSLSRKALESLAPLPTKKVFKSRIEDYAHDQQTDNNWPLYFKQENGYLKNPLLQTFQNSSNFQQEQLVSTEELKKSVYLDQSGREIEGPLRLPNTTVSDKILTDKNVIKLRLPARAANSKRRIKVGN